MRKTYVRFLRAGLLAVAVSWGVGGVALADEMGMGSVASGAAVMVVAPVAFLLSVGLLSSGAYFMVSAVRGHRKDLD